MHYGLLGILSLLPLVSPLPARAQTPPPVVFSEVNWAGSAAGTADEWLELTNVSDAMLDLSHWSVTGATGTETLVIAEGTLLSPGDTYLIANYDAGNEKSTLAITPDLVTTAISLLNSGLSLSLLTPDGTLADSFTSDDQLLSGSTNPYASSLRNLATYEWQTAGESVNLKTLEQLGTPGSVSVPTVVIGEEPSPVIEPVAEPVTEPVVTVVEPVVTPEEPIPTLTILEPTPEEPPLIEPTPIDILETPLLQPEPIETPAPITSDEPALISYDVGSVLINEFMSDPKDGVEWIEVMNVTDDMIDLTGFTVEDGSGSATPFPAELILPDTFFVLQNPKGKLNNDGDAIFIMDGTGATLDAISYDDETAPHKGTSLSRFDTAWAETPPTPLALNVRVDPLVNPTSLPYATTDNSPTDLDPHSSLTGETESTNDPSPTPPPLRLERVTQVEERVNAEVETLLVPEPFLPLVSASDVADYPDDTSLTVEGVLVGVPGLFGKQLAYLDGLEIYFNKADWPHIDAMTRVRVTGIVQAKEGYTRLKISERSAIEILEEDALAGEALESLEDAVHGKFMNAQGSVTDRTKDGLVLTLENGDILSVPEPKITGTDFTHLAYGDRVALSGVLLLKKGVWTLNLIDASHLTLLQSAETDTKEPSVPFTRAALSSSSKKESAGIPWLGGGLLTTSLGALGYWFARSKGITLPFIQSA